MTTDNTTALLQTLTELRGERDALRARVALQSKRIAELAPQAAIVGPVLTYARLDNDLLNAKRRYQKVKSAIQRELPTDEMGNPDWPDDTGPNSYGGYLRRLEGTDARAEVDRITRDRRNAHDAMRRAAAKAGLL